MAPLDAEGVIQRECCDYLTAQLAQLEHTDPRDWPRWTAKD